MIQICRCGMRSWLLFRHNSKFFSTRTNLNDLLLNMPREHQQEELKKIRLKIREKGSKYVPGTVTLQVLGSGARGAPRALYIFTDSTRYLFNCGEGSQRLAHEHKMKLSKLEHIFVTFPSWQNVGGLPGVALTIQDVGVPEIFLHGPPGTEQIFSATRRFVVLKNMSIRMAEYGTEHSFEDNVLSVKYVPLRPNREYVLPSRASSTSMPYSISGDSEDDDVDYYAHERVTKLQVKQPKQNISSQSEDKSASKCENIAMSYICKLKDKPGALNLEACVEKGVPPGPLLGRLKNGEDIILDNGTVVLSSEVTTPHDPGPVFIVIECPSEEYLEAVLTDAAYHPHQQGTSEEESAYLVVHFTPPAVLQNPRYKEWMNRFPLATQHLFINEDSTCMGSIAVHRLQHKLNLLHSGIFPLLRDQGIPVLQDQTLADTSPQTDVFPMQSRTFCNIHLRPRKGFDCTAQLALTPDVYINETFQTEGFSEELDSLKRDLIDFKARDGGEYPKVVFLGTGSCIPNKTRNTSGILVHTSEDDCILMDCGEGTYGQIVRFYGRAESDEVLRRLRGVYISHLHADHHIGLVGVLTARRRAVASGSSPLYLLAPKQIMPWLHLCHQTFEDVLSQFELIPNGDLRNGPGFTPEDQIHGMKSALKMKDVSTVLVRHCPNAFGVALSHEDGWKLTYSGDTMPCPDLIRIGEGSDIVIHEATMEDELEDEARFKQHSTTSQAISVGNEMKAKFILLTHFSQRYAKLPRLNDNFTSNVGIAFDNMQVSLKELPMLPKMYAALKLMFAEHCDELEYKAWRRQLKQDRKRAASSSPPREVKVAH